MPDRGRTVYIEGYGTPVFVGAGYLDDSDREGYVALKYPKYETEVYGSGQIEIPIDEFEENRVYPEQIPEGELIVKSNEKAMKKLGQKFIDALDDG